jgi:hypothetical protein
MTDRQQPAGKLERLLGRLRPATPETAASPKLRHPGRGPREEARLVFRKEAGADPLTGHRDAGAGLHVLAEVDGLVIDVQLREEGQGPVVLGQVIAINGAASETWTGALVHLRSTGGSALGCVEESGEFRVRMLPEGRLIGLDVELDERVVQVRWPASGSATDDS